MIARILTGGRVSKKHGRSASVALVEIDGDRFEVSQSGGPDPSPTVAQLRAVALGVYAAMKRDATQLVIATPSKRIAKLILGEPGHAIEDYHGALLAGWVIHWTRDYILNGCDVEVVSAKALPDVEEALGRLIEPPSHQGSLFE